MFQGVIKQIFKAESVGLGIKFHLVQLKVVVELEVTINERRNLKVGHRADRYNVNMIDGSVAELLAPALMV